MNAKALVLLSIALIGISLLVPAPRPVYAQTTASSCSASNITENFTQAQTNCSWYYLQGACLTAAPSGTQGGTSPTQVLPQCVGSSYYGSQTQYGGNSGNLNSTADTPTTGGALRLTNAANNEAGAIISNQPFNLASNGVQVQFTTETYAGDAGGTNKDGADGISFFLQDASSPVTLGDFGGSLGYTCSNTNNSLAQGYSGMQGGFIGLGVDEFGNFLNGTEVASTSTPVTYTLSEGADNTSSGYGKVPNRIGLRGPGSTNWATLSTNSVYSQYYPSTLSALQQTAAIRQACQTGYVWNYSSVTAGTPNTSPNDSNGFPNPYGAVETSIQLPNYQAIPNGYTVLTAHKLAVEGNTTLRGYSSGQSGYSVPITYNLTITTTGLLSLSYSYGGGNFLPVITGQQLPANLPSQVRFGFAGSTGGNNNVHEILCFQAQPQNSAASSAGVNQKQTAKIQTGTQVYFAYYNSNNWTGDVTSQSLDNPTNPATGQVDTTELQIDPAVNWSASCNLTGNYGGATTCGKTGNPLTSPPDPDAGRVMLTYNAGGVPFSWSSLSTSQQNNLDFADSTQTGNAVPPHNYSRLEYLRGQRTNEQNSQGVGPFRTRTSVLGDIIDSSPTWVGPPQVTYPATWSDLLHSSVTMPENSGTSYASFQSTNGNRLNVVYTGSNDGFLHGFETGKFSQAVNGTYDSTLNDGAEVLAYMPAYTVNSINSSTVANAAAGTPNYANDYANPLYAHKFSVDGTPGTGDLFYGGSWHTWLVSGLGAGGSAIFALDITNPSNFSQTNAASVVVGEWSSSLQSTTTSTTTGGVTTYSTSVSGGTATFSCVSTATDTSYATCGNSLGKTYGTPQIRRFHNDPTVTSGPNTSWGVVFGNGSGSYNGDAGIYVMMVNTSSGALAAPSFYYLGTGVGSRTGTPNGIYYVTPTDLDGDHVTDYVYAGDLQGNLWRFDLTSSNPANWAVSKVNNVPTPIYSTCSSSAACTAQPITSQVIVAAASGATLPRVLVEFGTGHQTQATQSASGTYATASQYIIGVWDYQMAGWNTLNPAVQYASATAGPQTTCFSGASLCGFTSMQAQSIYGPYTQAGSATSPSDQTASGAYFRTLSSTAICWAGQSGCTGTTAPTAPEYGWYLPLASGYSNIYDANLLESSNTYNTSMVYEQTIFNPVLEDGALLVNTTIPPTSALQTCSSTAQGGWTMAINPATGGAFSQSFFANSSHNFLVINVTSGASAVSGIALSGVGSPSVVSSGSNVFAITQTVNGAGAIAQINPPGGVQGSRLTWIEKR